MSQSPCCLLGRRFFQNAGKSLPLRGLSALLLLEIALLLLVVAPSQTHTMPSLLNVRFEKTKTLKEALSCEFCSIFQGIAACICTKKDSLTFVLNSS